ncbi:cytochrome P450 [Ganoderma sinense ZZ0214-1]|uniref:Cytochrome P450 n=1 Tax=Ganoderma sinense ZZ0214-1 TaxID=1077348 RepID=A0A2G8RZ96_9APHY|nr:cytochrome P450 [Ganoderma sinense ZZ0214-1]
MPSSPESASLALVLAVSALFAHQIFRKVETLCLPFHVSLLMLPPALVARLSVSSGRVEWTAFLNRLAFCYVTYIGALAGSIISYRLSPFHPLHRHPGPVWYRTSILFHAAHMVSGKQTRYLRQLHDTYGDIVRMGPNHLSIRDPSLVGQILGPAGIPKGPSTLSSHHYDTHVPFIGIQDVEEHSRRRRPWTRGLGPAALKGYEHIMSRRVHQLVDVLEQQQGPVALEKWIQYFTYDFMSEMVIGGGFEQLQNGDSNAIWATVGKGSQVATFLGQIPWLGVYLGYIPGITGLLKVLLEYALNETTRRLAQGSSTRDLFYYLRNEDLPDEAPPPTRLLLNDGVVGVAAATETTSTALISVFHCLLVNPEAYAALQDEVDRFYPQGEDVCNTASHRAMHYLTAFVNETLRLFPPVPTNSSRQAPHHSAPVVLGSLVIPPGTQVFVPPYALHHDARNFVFPDAFWPDRWLIASGQLPLSLSRLPAPAPASESPRGVVEARELDFDFVHNEAAFMPFSHRPINCAGKALAMQQLRTVVCALVQRFRIRLRLPEGEKDVARYKEEFEDSYLVANRAELPVVLEPRW